MLWRRVPYTPNPEEYYYYVLFNDFRWSGKWLCKFCYNQSLYAFRTTIPQCDCGDMGCTKFKEVWVGKQLLLCSFFSLQKAVYNTWMRYPWVIWLLLSEWSFAVVSSNYVLLWLFVAGFTPLIIFNVDAALLLPFNYNDVITFVDFLMDRWSCESMWNVLGY